MFGFGKKNRSKLLEEIVRGDTLTLEENTDDIEFFDEDDEILEDVPTLKKPVSGLDRLKRKDKVDIKQIELEEIKKLDEARMYRNLVNNLYDSYDKQEFQYLVDFVNHSKNVYESLRDISKAKNNANRNYRIFHKETISLNNDMTLECIIRNISDPSFVNSAIYKLECMISIPIVDIPESRSISNMRKIKELKTYGSGELGGMYINELKDLLKVLQEGYKEYPF